jgi:peptidoglycan/xylan/chitin deacetylase (PgdA/CDA1 family)
MSDPGVWPGDARAAICITVDNLGEAAEIELGLRGADAPLGGHYSVTTALPIMLAELAKARLSATFFLEGINAEIYPDALTNIAQAGHEVAYHAWCHEDWSQLDDDAQAANLDRGLRAFEAIGIQALGFRPPGGRISARTLELLAARSLRYCSPAGSAPGIELVAVLPFAWEEVDVFHVLEAFAPLREHLNHEREPGGPAAVRSALLQSIEGVLADGGQRTLVLHTWMIELEREVVSDVLGRVREAVDGGDLWAAPCAQVAAWMAEHPAQFSDRPKLDETSWTAPS